MSCVEQNESLRKLVTALASVAFTSNFKIKFESCQAPVCFQQNPYKTVILTSETNCQLKLCAAWHNADTACVASD